MDKQQQSYSPSKFLIKVNKRNRYYLNQNNSNEPDLDENVLSPIISTITISPKRVKSTIDEKTKIHNLANRLKTLLKLPKAHKWSIYEFFYSNLDQPLFCYNRPNDFQLFLNDIFPQLKTRNLRRTEWCQIRKLMGKPRRCSDAFLEEERQTLKRKREKIREINLNSNIDNLSDYQDLPDTISLPLIIGSKCTVLFKKTHDGLFNGTVNAIDLQSGTYRVSFDKPGFGCENIYDFEVRSVDKVETMPLVAFESKKNRSMNNVKKLNNQLKLTELTEDSKNINYHSLEPCSDNFNDQFTNQLTNLNYSQPDQLNSFFKTEQSSSDNNSTELSNELNSINSDESFVRFMNHCSLNSNNTSSLTSLSMNNSATNLTINQSLTDNQTNSSSANQMYQLNDKEKLIGNYPLKFLTCIINFYKLINKKSVKLNELKSMNTQAEYYKSSDKSKLSNEFRNEYATIILELEKIKDNINLNLELLDNYVKELKITKPLKNGHQTEDEFVKRNLMDKKIDQNSKNLIKNLIGLLLMLKNCADSEEDQSSIQLKLKSIKQTLQPKNGHCFENNIELHFNHLSLDKITSSRLNAFHNDHL